MAPSTKPAPHFLKRSDSASKKAISQVVDHRKRVSAAHAPLPPSPIRPHVGHRRSKSAPHNSWQADVEQPGDGAAAEVHKRKQHKKPLQPQLGLGMGFDRPFGVTADLEAPLLQGQTATIAEEDESDLEDEKDVPLVGLHSTAEVKAEAYKQWAMAVPISTMNVFEFLLALVSVMFVGHLGASQLAAAALAASVANVTGISVMVRFVSMFYAVMALDVDNLWDCHVY
jgi:hypothetical protein